MAHFLSTALQKSFWIIDVDTAPETKINGDFEGFDLCEGTIDIINWLSPFNRFLCFWSRLQDDVANS